MIRILAADTSLWSDDVWVADSTPIECGRSRETARRSAPAGWAEYGYCASHSRYFWGLRLHLLCTLGGLPVLYALSGAKADEREVLLGMLQAAPDVMAAHPEQTIIADRHYYGRVFEAELTERELQLLRPARQSEPERPGAALDCSGRGVSWPLDDVGVGGGRSVGETVAPVIAHRDGRKRGGARGAVTHRHGASDLESGAGRGRSAVHFQNRGHRHRRSRAAAHPGRRTRPTSCTPSTARTRRPVPR
ncbi:transposase [Nonomuraea wenchangensis]|uniref:transposase n=1 Tax=Nonomuraea wenchangensis TaxID=568860 RepID=UPI003850960F